MEKKTFDLTEGGILKKLLLVAFPIMGTQLMQMTYNLTDMFWLGRMQDSVIAVAASGLAGMFMWLSMALLMVGRMGSEIGTSQNLGRGDEKSARGYAETAARMALGLGFIYGAVLIVFAGPLVSLLQVKEPLVYNAACSYLRIVGIGTSMTFLSGAITGSFNGAGNSKLTFLANSVGLVVNMILDPLMIFTFGWGIKGAAIATIIAQGVVMGLFIWFSKHHPARPFEGFTILGSLDRDKARQIMAWSLPVALESAAFTSLAMVVTAMVSAWYGETAVAIQRVGSQIESLSWLIGGGFASAITSFVGQNYGAGKWGRIRRGYRVSLAVLFGWEIFVTGVLYFGGGFLFSLFLKDPPGILEMGSTYLRILALSQVFMALEGASSGVFRGMGKTLPPSISSITSNILRPVFCLFFAKGLGFGLNGIWMGIAASAAFRGIFMAAWYVVYERSIPHENETRVFGREAPSPGVCS